MTEQGRWYAFGAGAILLLALVLLLWSVLLWIGLGLSLLLLCIIGWRVWRSVHHGRMEARMIRAEAVKAEALAEQEQAKAEQQRALAEQYRATAATLWAQQRMIPASMVGIMLDDPAQRERVMVWPQPRKIVYTAPPPAVPALPAKAAGDELPRAEAFVTIREQVGPDHFYLGNVLEDGRQCQLWAPLDMILTLVAIGPQGVGKSTLIRSLALQQAMQGGELHIVDWYNDLAREMGGFFTHCYALAGQIEAYAGQVLLPELEARRLAWQGGQEDFPAVFLAIDEWLELQPECPTMAEALRKGFSIGRKIGLRLGLSSVALEARQLGISKSAPSAVALFTPNRNVANQWGLYGAEVEAELQKLYKAGRGYCVISSLLLGQRATLLALPDVSPRVFRETLQRYRPDLIQRAVDAYPGLPTLPMKREAMGTAGTGRILPFPHSQESPQAKNAGILSQREREYIATRYRAGTLRTAIRDELRVQRKDGFSNRHWAELAAICDAIDAEEAEA